MRIGLRELEATFKYEAPRPKKVAKWKSRERRAMGTGKNLFLRVSLTVELL